MDEYVVNRGRQVSGEHEVHNLTKGCQNLPRVENRVHLGFHPSCHMAIWEAKKHYSNVDGCYWCANDCHTR